MQGEGLILLVDIILYVVFVMAALRSRCGHYICVLFFMVALWNRETIYIFMLWFVLLLSFFSSPNLSSRRLDVYHTSAHGVVLV